MGFTVEVTIPYLQMDYFAKENDTVVLHYELHSSCYPVIDQLLALKVGSGEQEGLLSLGRVFAKFSTPFRKKE